MTTHVWPFRPTMNVVESAEWLTHITRARTAEYRLCKRPIPRIGYQHKYVLSPDAYGAAMTAARAIGEAECYVPDWPNHVHIPTISIATVTLPVDAAMVPAYAAGKELLIWESNTSWETRTIQEIGDGTITIEATTREFTRPTIAPLRLGLMTENFASDREPIGPGVGGDKVQASAGFTVIVGEDLTPTYGDGIEYPEYLGSPVVTDPVEIVNGAREENVRELSTCDCQTGMVVRTPIFATPNREFVVAWYRENRADLWDLRLWLHSRKGKCKNFWLPSHNQDLTVVAQIGSGATTIQVADMGLRTTGVFPMHFKLELAGTTCACVRVASAAAGSAGREVLTLDEVYTLINGTPVYSSQFMYTFALAEIGRMSALTLSRFDSDHIEIQHLPGSAATVVVPTTEDPNVPGLPA